MAKNSSAPLFRARLALRVTTAKRLLTEEHNAKIENPCVGGSIPPRATKNIVHETPTITGWRFCLWNS